MGPWINPEDSELLQQALDEERLPEAIQDVLDRKYTSDLQRGNYRGPPELIRICI